MSEELVCIRGQKRSGRGKGYCRKLRLKGMVPANIIHKTESTMVEIEGKWLSKAWKQNKTFKLQLENDDQSGVQERVVRIQELQVNPTKRTAVHVDLMYV